jgi:DNA-binding response OmpR family regulator
MGHHWIIENNKLRWANSIGIDIGRESTIRSGHGMIFPERYEVFKGNEEIELSTREFQLLMYLHNNIGQVLTREQIFDEVWGLDYSDIGTVTVTIKNLRDKIDPDNNYIKTVWGVGYKLVKPMG